MEKATTIYKVDPGDPEFEQHYQIRVIEPLGMTPMFIIVDMTPYDEADVYGLVTSPEALEQKLKSSLWPPLNSQIRYCHEKVMDCYYRILDQTGERFDRGIYNLDRYRFHKGKYGGKAIGHRIPLIVEPPTKEPEPVRKRAKRQKGTIASTMEHIKKINKDEQLVNSDPEDTQVNTGMYVSLAPRKAYEEEEEDNNYSIYD